MKKICKTKNGQKVYWTLHTLLLGGQGVVSTGSAIVTKLQSFKCVCVCVLASGYEGGYCKVRDTNR